MRISLFFALAGLALAALPAAAQETAVSTKTAVDINGRRAIEGPQIVETRTAGGAEITERARSINGRMAPFERIEERIVRDGPAGRVIERIIRAYDATGNPSPAVKEIVEEQNRPDGSRTISTSRYAGDINGRLQLAERSVMQAHKSEAAESSETVVERPSINGSFEPVAKVTVTRVKAGAGYREDSVTYRKNGGGGFYEAVRRSSERTVEGPRTVDSSAEYEIGASGRLELHSQEVRSASRAPDGSQEIQIDLFARDAPGTSEAAGSGLKLKEREIVTRRPAEGNAVVETLSVRRPSISDPQRLGPVQRIAETVCKGKCD